MAQSVVIGLLCSDWSDGIGLPLQHESETKPITISEYPQRLLHNNTNSSDGILFSISISALILILLKCMQSGFSGLVKVDIVSPSTNEDHRLALC